MKEKKILAMFDYIATTGFGTVSNNLVRELKKYFGSNIKLDIIAINYFGEGYWEDENTYVQSGKLNDIKEDDFGRYWFLKKLQDIDYDGVFILQDLGVVSPILEIVKYIKDEKREANRKQFKTIFYFPVDCNLGIPQLLNNIEYCDLLVAYTKFGKNEVLKTKPELKNKIRVVPHGNNPKDFYPLPQEEIKKFRKEFYGENADKFIITNVNRNQPRKDIGNTIFGFIEAKKNWDASLPKPFLYLHCHPQDPMGNDLRVVLNQSELIEDIDYKLLPKEFERTMVDIEFLNKIYNSVDCYANTTLGEGWGLCLEPYTKILISNGSREIKDIKIGDEVMTNSGTFQKVLDITSRKIESYVRIKTKYGYVVEATHEHPYYSLVNGKEAYRKIGDIKEGDYLAIVKQKSSNKLPKKIDLLDYLPKSQNWVSDEDSVYNKWGYSPYDKKWSITSICEKYSTTKKIVENAIAYIIGKKEKVSEVSYRLANNLIADGFDKPMPLKINRFVELNEDILWVFGWYLAEGSCEGGKRLEFSMGKKALNDAHRIAKIITDNFGVKDITIRKFPTKCAVRVSSVALALIFRELFGNGAYNKRIPKILFKSPKSLIPLVDGYIKGDGHINLDINCISFSTISPSLAYQMQSILVSNNLMISVQKNKNRIGSNYDFYNCSIPNAHLRRYMNLVNIQGKLGREGKRNHKPDFIETETHFFVPIISIKEINENSEFYDLCVENSHSFVANGLVAHNTFSEAASCKIPIIASYSTSFMEMSNYGKNAWMLETLYPYLNLDNIIREQTDIYELADRLLEVAKGKYSNSKEFNDKIERSYQWAKSLDWSLVCKQWIEYFKEMYKLEKK